jgi:predicted transcriptional regulator
MENTGMTEKKIRNAINNYKRSEYYVLSNKTEKEMQSADDQILLDYFKNIKVHPDKNEISNLALILNKRDAKYIKSWFERTRHRNKKKNDNII